MRQRRTRPMGWQALKQGCQWLEASELSLDGRAGTGQRQDRLTGSVRHIKARRMRAPVQSMQGLRLSSRVSGGEELDWAESS